MAAGKMIPAFLEKTYKLVSAPETKDIVDWGNNGLTFVIKRPKDFSDIILPQFFRHNKFSSFVRQLNFYGFHKLRTDDAGTMNAGKIDPNADLGWWEFKHEFFQKGKKDLLSRIKRKTHNEGGEKADVEELRLEVLELKSQLTDLTRSVSSLTQLLVNSGMASSAITSAMPLPAAPAIGLDPSVSVGQYSKDILPISQQSPLAVPSTTLISRDSNHGLESTKTSLNLSNAPAEKKRKVDFMEPPLIMDTRGFGGGDLIDLNEDLDSFFATLDFDSFAQSN